MDSYQIIGNILTLTFGVVCYYLISFWVSKSKTGTIEDIYASGKEYKPQTFTYVIKYIDGKKFQIKLNHPYYLLGLSNVKFRLGATRKIIWVANRLFILKFNLMKLYVTIFLVSNIMVWTKKINYESMITLNILFSIGSIVYYAIYTYWSRNVELKKRGVFSTAVVLAQNKTRSLDDPFYSKISYFHKGEEIIAYAEDVQRKINETVKIVYDENFPEFMKII